MARKELDITITDEGRDKGKTFHIREMPAAQAEKWAIRVISLAAKAGVDIGTIDPQMGMAGIALMGFNALMAANFEDIEPLLDDMMGCISIKPDAGNPSIMRPIIQDDDIEEIGTRFRLRREVVLLHVGFSQTAAPSNTTSSGPAPASSSSNTPTFPEPSVRFSRSQKTKR
ncbi:hypothetical protein FHX10_003412 [Rhizobium sp. BK591]|uniref:hypothetical protein n=1 Tax=Rhizobium sp. BK591 TaxID=2586985 RepID=UPI001622B229|nr:hypothetical protein [Rhizobium sp. BK591]MBB3743913.1 hypothetical protein [Rhizobium sp. BK591]